MLSGKTLDELTNDDIRLEIAKELDYRPPENQLRKKHLNGLYAYFEGEFYIPMEHMGSSQIDYETVLTRTLSAALAHSPPPKYQGEDAPPRPLTTYLEDIKYHDRPYPPPRLNKEELKDLVWAMEQSDDNRDWLEADDD